jgi:hypothetical protein
MSGSNRVLLAAVLVCFGAVSSHGAEIDFSGLPLAANSYWNGADDSGGFSTGGVFFNNEYVYYPEWGMESWTGWSYSNITSTSSGYSNQYSAITGGGIAGAGSKYAVGYVDSPNGAFIDLGIHQAVSLKVTNTAYAYHSMKDGDAFAKKFGASDWFKLTIRGFESAGATGSTTGQIEFLLASGTNIVDQWVSIDLSSISAGARSLGFELTSSDTGSFGMNTPAYFAMGSLTVAPEPGTAILAIVAGMTLALLRRRKA